LQRIFMQDQAARVLRLGFLVPSSNTVVEPVTYHLLQALPQPQPSAHFARLRVVRVHSDSGAQFDNERRIEAASSLADALCDAIAWNGTSASWLGVQQDRDLCSALTSSFTLPATSSTLATVAALSAMQARTYALVTPYTDDIQVRPSSRTARAALNRCTGQHSRQLLCMRL
jgi:maleate isomerase